jgi:hypothetical protein
VILHNDIDVPFAKAGASRVPLADEALLHRHPNATIIWAHTGLGRVSIRQDSGSDGAGRTEPRGTSRSSRSC